MTERKKWPITIAGMLSGKRYFCVWCGEEVFVFRDVLSAREYRISGLCQDCQDKTFGGR